MFSRTHSKSTAFLIAVALLLSIGSAHPLTLAGVRATGAPQLFLGDTLNPAAYGFPIDAREVPEKRGERSAVFELSPGKYASVSSGNPLFSQMKDGSWIPIRIERKQEGSEFVFDRLAGDTEISFDLTHPQYTLHHDGHWYTIRFNHPTVGVIESENTVSYILDAGVILRWTVEGQRVRKEIFFDDPKASADLSFTVTSDLDAQLEGNHLSFDDVFSFPEPFLTDLSGETLDTPVALVRRGNGYAYDYTAPDVPYILDPSEGPNSPGTVVADSSFGLINWSNTSNATASDNQYATSAAFIEDTTYYLKATNFGFAITTGATIDGIVVEVERKRGGDTNCHDIQARIVKGGTIGSTDKSIVGNWPTSDAYGTYGTSSDLWGETWTTSSINDSNFGFALAAEADSSFGDGSIANVDHIRITVYYSEAAVPVFPWAVGIALTVGLLLLIRRFHPSKQ